MFRTSKIGYEIFCRKMLEKLENLEMNAHGKGL